MIRVYELFGDNPIIAALMLDGNRSIPLRSARASKPLLREPFVEAMRVDGEIELHTFSREGFADSWAEARLILALLSNLDIQSDFDPGILERESQRRVEILHIRDHSIGASRELFAQGRFAEVVECYGPDCGHLPGEVDQMLNAARQQIKKTCPEASQKTVSESCHETL